MLAIISGVENCSWNGVSITPGDTPFTRIPCGAISLASDLVYVMSAPLAVEYGPAPGPPPLRPAIDTMLTIEPRLRAIIEGATACEQKIADFKFSAIILSQASSVMSASGTRFTSEPALLIRISMGPSSAMV